MPSIDIAGGTTVQLIGGEEPALDAGDPRAVMERFARVGEVAVVDIDAARGEGRNSGLIRQLCELGRVRVGGGIRTADLALEWLDAGAEKIIVGTAADESLLAALPRDRVIVALDARHGEVQTHGWREGSGRDLLDSIRRFRDLSEGFLVTFIEREGRLGGTDLEMAARVVAEAGDARVTIAGGVSSAAEIAALDDLGADAQVGMALYTGMLGLADAFTAPLRSDRPDGLWPTVVTDERGVALGLAYSSHASLDRALETGRGVYESRTRGIWTKGETSGHVQHLIAVDADCDRDTLRFTVRQDGGFCHQGHRTCWGEDRGLGRLARRVAGIEEGRPEGSNTVRLLDSPELLDAKLREEIAELTAGDAQIDEETADLLYFTLVKSIAGGFSLEDVERILDRRERRVTRRPMKAKEVD